MSILFVGTGGTIDKDYPKTLNGYAFEICQPAVQKIIHTVSPSFKYTVQSVVKKDSLDLTQQDRNIIADTCANAQENMIVITHGTSTYVSYSENCEIYICI